MFNWRKIPLVRLIIPFILGIFAAIYWQFVSPEIATLLIYVSFASLFLMAVVKTEFRQRWLFGIPLSIFLFFVGYQLTVSKNELNDARHFSRFWANNSEGFAIGVVTDKVEKEQNFRLILSVQNVGRVADSLPQVSGNLLVYLKKDSSQAPPQYGDLILVETKIREVEPPKNPEAFSFKQYLHLQNIHYQAFIKFNNFKVLGQNRGNPVIATALAWQHHFVNILRKHLPTENEYAVGTALLLGYKDAVNDEIKNAYIETGAMHILAISGMHIILIFSQLEKILNLYKTGNRRIRWLKTIVLIILIALFALLTGMGASIMRAAVMASFAAIGKAMKRTVSIYNVLAASAFVLLLWNPYWLVDVGFQLSYMAVIGIAFFADKFQKLLAFSNPILNWAWSNISIGLAAQLAVTPISIFYFHQFPVYFWLTGLVAGLVADVALLTGVVLLAIDGIPFLGFVGGKILFGSLWLMNQFIFLIHKLPFSILEGFWVTLWEVILLYFIIATVVAAVHTRRLQWLIYPLSICVFLSGVYAFSDIKSQSNRQIIIYNLYRNSLMDVVDGKDCYSFFNKLSTPILTDAKIKFAASNYRNSLKINNLKTFNFNEYLKNNNIIYQNGFMNFAGVKIIALDKLPKKGITLETRFVVIRSSPKFSIADLKQIFSFEEIIFDGSNSPWQVKKWKTECDSLGVKYYDVAEKGAWVHKF